MAGRRLWPTIRKFAGNIKKRNSWIPAFAGMTAR